MNTSSDLAPAGSPHLQNPGMANIPVPSKTVVRSPSDLSPELNELVKMLQAYGTTNNWEAMRTVLVRLDEDAYYDHPLLYIQGRERIRVLSSILALMVEKEVDPKVVRLKMTDTNRAEMDVDASCRFVSARYWWLPLSYLVPAIPLETTSSIIVKGWNNRISHLTERFHNLPCLPLFARYIIGWSAGTIALMMEPMVQNVLNFAEAGVERATAITTSVLDDAIHLPVIGTTIDMTLDMATSAATSAYDSIADKLENVQNMVNEKVLGPSGTAVAGASGAESLGVAGVGLTPMTGSGTGSLTGAGAAASAQQSATGKHSNSGHN